MVIIPKNLDTISTQTGQAELSTSNTGNGTKSQTSSWVEQVPVKRHSKKVVSKYVVQENASTIEAQHEASFVERSGDNVSLTDIVDNEEISPRVVKIIEKEERLPTANGDEEPSSTITTVPNKTKSLHLAKLNFNPFVLTIFIFLVTSIISTDMEIKSFIIRSLRDFCMWGMPIYWVVSKEEIRLYVKLKFQQAKSRWGYY